MQISRGNRKSDPCKNPNPSKFQFADVNNHTNFDSNRFSWGFIQVCEIWHLCDFFDCPAVLPCPVIFHCHAPRSNRWLDFTLYGLNDVFVAQAESISGLGRWPTFIGGNVPPEYPTGGVNTQFQAKMSKRKKLQYLRNRKLEQVKI